LEKIDLRRLLDRLGGEDPQQAWLDFLHTFGGVILDAVHLSERDVDHQSDCFLFVCEKLVERGYRRLRHFRVDGPASFNTWLRAVVRNLCVDWRREVFGRERLFQSVRRLGRVEQRAFEYLYMRGFPGQHAVELLQADFPDVSASDAEAALERLHRAFSARQLWLLQTRHPEVHSLDASPLIEGDRPRDVPSGEDDPETTLAKREALSILQQAVASLSDNDRLLLQLRYEQDLTLSEIAVLANLNDAFVVNRRIRTILGKLRSEIRPAAAKTKGRVREIEVGDPNEQ
jgi:RNA polymerase sigma factor (sigma-70 family)